MADCCPARTPATEVLTRAPPLSEEEKSELVAEWGSDYHARYRALVGSLMWLTHSTRPDTTFATIQLARFVQSPGPNHFKALKRLLRYLRGTIDYGLIYKRSVSKKAAGFADADFAGDPKTRRSTTGMIFMMNGAAILWKTRLQKLVTLSTCEAELVALCETAKEALWLRRLLKDLSLDETGVPASAKDEGSALNIYEDNKAALAIAHSGIQKSRNKHMEVRYFWVH
jgi:hypothetical protein